MVATLYAPSLRNSPRISQAEARYTPAGGREKCGACRHFVSQGACTRILGPVSPRGWCKLFSQQVPWHSGGAVGSGSSAAGGPTDTSLDLNFLTMAPTLDPRITFTRASTATYFDATGTMQTAAANAARFDNDPVALTPRGLLIEEARTNLLLNSATLSTQSVTTTAAATTLSFYGTGTVTKSGTATGALVGTGAFPTRVSQTFTPTAGSLTLTVTGSVLNAQIETGAFPTSYIPTTGATATRAAESCTVPSLVPWYSSSASSFVLEGTMMHAWPAGVNSYWLILDDTTASNRIGMISQGTLPNSVGEFVSGSGTTYSNGNGVLNLTPPTNFKYAIAVGSAQLAIYGNGTQLRTGTGAAPPVGVSRLALGTLGSVPISSYLRRLRYWPRVLSNTEMQAVTT